MQIRPLVTWLLLFFISLLTLNTIAATTETDNKILRMATTTSTENSGLLDYLLPAFQKASGYEVQVIAVGTGKALKMGENGDVDIVMVHAPAAEHKFVDNGFGVKRNPVMYNDFVIIGPENDPAHIKSLKSSNEAFAKIAESKQLFISRGDDSGTHKKEKGLWTSSDTIPDGSWYREAGQGMGKVIQMAGELDAYTLTDRGTWLAMMDKSSLKIAFEGDKQLHNPYGIIAVSPERYPDINFKAAQSLITWITSEKGQQLISEFRVADKQLFTPSATTMQAEAETKDN